MNKRRDKGKPKGLYLTTVVRFLGSYFVDLAQKVEHYLEAVGCGGSIPSISIVLLGKIITTTDAGMLANNL